MGEYFTTVTTKRALFNAWKQIKSNGHNSRARETREALDLFDQDPDRNLNRIQKHLRKGTFRFDPQTGILKSKKSGGKRGLVMASVHNRIVERALLDCLQSKSEFIKKVITQSTSIGGVPHRSVPHGLYQIQQGFRDGMRFFIRSDISGFFDHVPRQTVIKKIAENVNDEKFIDLLEQATLVILSNEATLGEDRKAFPTDDVGIAQGSPLSPLFGNILLYEFDLRFNGKGIVCIRFIDDFVLLGKDLAKVRKAFHNARNTLGDIGMKCHDPFNGTIDRNKAEQGLVEKGFVFLGYDIRPGLLQPSAKARQTILRKVEDIIYQGKRAIAQVKKAENSFEHRQRYVQTQDIMDRVIRGWGDAFAYGNSSATIEAIDVKLEERISIFRKWYADQIKATDWKTRRRTGGVCLISDISPKSLDELPFQLAPGATFRGARNPIHVSTDGSVFAKGSCSGKHRGPGGWAFKIHGSDEERSGWERDTTNNRMELRAVVEALKFLPHSRPIKIWTDSQYICNAVNNRNVTKSNWDLWKEFVDLCKTRRVKVIWVKGHSGDPHNERVDRLAKEQAQSAKSLIVGASTGKKVSDALSSLLMRRRRAAKRGGAPHSHKR